MKKITLILLCISLILFGIVLALAISAVWIADYNTISGSGFTQSKASIGLSDKLNQTALILTLPSAICFISAITTIEKIEVEW